MQGGSSLIGYRGALLFCIKITGKGEILLTILSSLSQDEARSISENVTWGLRKKFQDGKFSVGYSRFLGYDKGEDGNLAINEEQAKIVRLIFELFIEGLTPCASTSASCASVAEFDEGLWGAMVDYVTVGADGGMTVVFRDGTELEE